MYVCVCIYVHSHKYTGDYHIVKEIKKGIGSKDGPEVSKREAKMFRALSKQNCV